MQLKKMYIKKNPTVPRFEPNKKKSDKVETYSFA